jgi:hypothetical protein
MRDVLHVIATGLVVAAAVLCTLVQVNDVDRAIDHLRDDGTRAGRSSAEHTSAERRGDHAQASR